MGVDVSKRKLDTCIKTQTDDTLIRYTFSNTETGRKHLIVLLRKHAGPRVVMEATSSYHLSLMYDLTQANIAFMVVNPFCAKSYARSKNLRSKTDSIDAQTLAEYGCERPFEPTKMPSDILLKIRQLGSAILFLTRQRTATKNHLHTQQQMPIIEPLARKEIKANIAQLDRRIERLTQEMDRLVQQCYAQTYALMSSVTGIGTQTSLMLISFLGDLQSFSSAKQLAHFMGIGNVSFQSGDYSRTRRISRRGHARLRSQMYLCALSAARHNTSCRNMYQRLLAKGKPKKVALIAVANKLIRQVYAVVKNETPFENNYLERHEFSLAS